MNYTSASIQMYALIGDEVVDIERFECDYAINTIPKATAVLPVGREVSTMLPSAAHAISRETTIQIPTQIFCRVTHAGGDPAELWPEGDYMLFAGWTTGIGYQHTYNGLGMAIEITHWLSALTFSSTLSGASSPNNPSHFAFRAALKKADTPGGASIHSNTLAHKFFTPDGIRTDLWGECIQPWLISIAEEDRFNYQAFGDELKKNDSANDDCVKALNKFTGDKLPMDVDGMKIAAHKLRNAIADDVAYGTLTPSAKAELMKMATTTFWDAIVRLASEYRFAIIPLPRKALVVPYVAGLQEVWNPSDTDFTIQARDLDAYNVNHQLRAPLRAIGVYTGHASRAGFFGAKQRMAPGAATCGGWFIAREEGTVKIEPAPSFMSLIRPDIHSKDSSAAEGKKVKANAVDPTAGEEPEEDEPKKTEDEQEGPLNKYARALFATETLRHRSGHLGGPARVDICPGSNIRIEGTSGSFLAGVDPHGEPRYATVYRVRVAVDAQAPSAGTTFELSNVRTETENEEESTSIERHPLYDRVWTGDYLVEEG